MSGAADARAVLAAVEARREELVGLVEALARIETPSSDPVAQGPALDLLGGWLADVGLSVRRQPGVRTGGLLHAVGAGEGPRQLVLGHVDTVWPHGTLAARAVTLEGDVLRGPGVLDMKGGLAMLVLALRVLREFGVAPSVRPEVIACADEEIASPESTPLIAERAVGADRVLVLEPAAPGGQLKVARKAVGGFVIEVDGRPSHAGSAPEQGRSAIVELAHQVLAAVALHDPGAGVTVNVGRIAGGIARNVVAPAARAELDVRAPDPAAAAGVEAALLALRPVTPDVVVRVQGRFHRPPMSPTPAPLRALAHRCAGELGLTLGEAAVGGGSDGSTTSWHAPTLDGLGAVGEGPHAVDEHLLVGPTLRRTALLALLLAAPPLG